MNRELSGWRTFSGVVFYLVGVFNVIGGLAALFKEEIFVVGKNGLLVADYTAWGWFLLIVGILQACRRRRHLPGQRRRPPPRHHPGVS